MRIEAEPWDTVRNRTSAKWTMFDSDVLPLPIAEADYPLAEPIATALRAAIDRSDTGYQFGSRGVAEAFSGFSERHWGWTCDPTRVKITTDVSVALVETVRAVTAPGDGVVICPPVYPPFFGVAEEAGRELRTVPLLGNEETGWSIDFEGIAREFRSGARALIWCSPHNPLGRVWTREELAQLAELAAEHDAWVISDEIHAPLTFDGERFVPFPSVSDAARNHGIVVTSASKAFNLAGLKCAHIVADSDRAWDALSRLPVGLEWRASLLGAIANETAYRECDTWLSEVRERIGENTRLLSALLAEHVPTARFRPGTAGYLAWVNLGDTSLALNGPERLLTKARLAVGVGADFGAEDHIRINVACQPELLEEAVRRIAQLA